MKRYLYFFYKLVLLLIIVGVLDYIIGYTLNYYYFRQSSGKQYRTTVSMEQTTADILVFGSSRANHHFYPEPFKTSLNQSFYNAGRDGEYIFYHYGVLKSVLKRYHPKLIIFDLQRREFIKTQESYDKLSSLLPYYATHPEIRDIVHLKSPYEKIKLLSKTYPFNSTPLAIVAGMGKFSRSTEKNIDGYVPLNNMWTAPLAPQDIRKQKQYDIDTTKVNVFKAFIEDCKKANVKVVVVCSPYYYKFNKPDQTLQQAKDIANKMGVPFYDFSTNSYFLNRRQLFSDPLHLNHQGAVIFSQMLSQKMSENTTLQPQK